MERTIDFLMTFIYLTDGINTAAIHAFENIPEPMKKSLTVDNSKEFAHHKKLNGETMHMNVYFCNFNSQWQRKLTTGPAKDLI